MFVIDPRDKSPLYEQLIRQLRWQIGMGYLSPDEPLPSVRQLSGELGINPNTIQKAYRQMEQEGLIYSRPGRGSFVTATLTEEREKQKQAKRESLREELKAAREMGITKDEAQSLINEIYGEGRYSLC